MKKIHLYILLALFLFITGAHAQQLRFHKDGTFKIVQFTDTHVVPDKTESLKAIKLINETIDKEHPDLIIFSGDVVTGKPARQGWKMVLSTLEQKGIPFCIAMGNHDPEQDLSRSEIADLITATNRSLNKKDTKGLCDMALEVKSSKDNAASALIYCMDSNDYSKIDTVKGYGWFSFDQIQWYRQTSAQYTLKNGGKPLPALSFFHIPLPEFFQAYKNERNSPVGKRLEDECPASVNSGMFASMLECGDVMGVFVGHDHDNDYLASLHGIALGYGRFSGGKTTYINIQNGARIITLKEGERGFSTYIRLLDGSEICSTTYPGTFK
ncbi:metallophosphoesterase family protein [Bacteroides sedimenti]|uniref:Metallophosphatase n=1 Tax=Bacteroides sedimenti TaxID=2136147 RepID=A0ABM8II44_9BACE